MISPSDPCSAWTAKANKRVQFGYGLNYLIDIENAVIVDVEATPARTYDEVAATKTMIERTEACFDLKPERLAADTAYGTGKFLGWLVGDGSRRISRCGRRPTRGRHLLALDFTFDKAARTSICCPNGKALRTTGTVHDGRHDPLSREQARLRSVPVEGAMLPERRRGAKIAARRPRRCARYGACAHENAGVRQIPR